MKEKSDENWEVGLRCLKEGKLNVAASRLYYALFQSVYQWAKKIKSYSGSPRVHEDMVKLVRDEGGRQVHYSNKLNDFRSLRVTADYDREPPSESDIKELLEDADAMRNHYFKKTLLR